MDHHSDCLSLAKKYQNNLNFDNRYQIIADNIINLQIRDTQTHQTFYKRPDEILFSDEYKFYSKEDLVKIAYICGQMSLKK